MSKHVLLACRRLCVIKTTGNKYIPTFTPEKHIDYDEYNHKQKTDIDDMQNYLFDTFYTKVESDNEYNIADKIITKLPGSIHYGLYRIDYIELVDLDSYDSDLRSAIINMHRPVAIYRHPDEIDVYHRSGVKLSGCKFTPDICYMNIPGDKRIPVFSYKMFRALSYIHVPSDVAKPDDVPYEDFYSRETTECVEKINKRLTAIGYTDTKYLRVPNLSINTDNNVCKVTTDIHMTWEEITKKCSNQNEAETTTHVSAHVKEYVNSKNSDTDKCGTDIIMFCREMFVVSDDVAVFDIADYYGTDNIKNTEYCKNAYNNLKHIIHVTDTELAQDVTIKCGSIIMLPRCCGKTLKVLCRVDAFFRIHNNLADDFISLISRNYCIGKEAEKIPKYEIRPLDAYSREDEFLDCVSLLDVGKDDMARDNRLVYCIKSTCGETEVPYEKYWANGPQFHLKDIAKEVNKYITQRDITSFGLQDIVFASFTVDKNNNFSYHHHMGIMNWVSMHDIAPTFGPYDADGPKIPTVNIYNTPEPDDDADEINKRILRNVVNSTYGIPKYYAILVCRNLIVDRKSGEPKTAFFDQNNKNHFSVGFDDEDRVILIIPDIREFRKLPVIGDVIAYRTGPNTWSITRFEYMATPTFSSDYMYELKSNIYYKNDKTIWITNDTEIAVLYNSCRGDIAFSYIPIKKQQSTVYQYDHSKPMYYMNNGTKIPTYEYWHDYDLKSKPSELISYENLIENRFWYDIITNANNKIEYNEKDLLLLAVNDDQLDDHYMSHCSCSIRETYKPKQISYVNFLIACRSGDLTTVQEFDFEKPYIDQAHHTIVPYKKCSYMHNGLYEAIVEKQYDVIRILIHKGASLDIMYKDSGWSALDKIIVENDYSMTQFVLREAGYSLSKLREMQMHYLREYSKEEHSKSFEAFEKRINLLENLDGIWKNFIDDPISNSIKSTIDKIADASHTTTQESYSNPIDADARAAIREFICPKNIPITTEKKEYMSSKISDSTDNDRIVKAVQETTGMIPRVFGVPDVVNWTTRNILPTNVPNRNKVILNRIDALSYINPADLYPHRLYNGYYDTDTVSNKNIKNNKGESIMKKMFGNLNFGVQNYPSVRYSIYGLAFGRGKKEVSVTVGGVSSYENYVSFVNDEFIDVTDTMFVAPVIVMPVAVNSINVGDCIIKTDSSNSEETEYYIVKSINSKTIKAVSMQDGSIEEFYPEKSVYGFQYVVKVSPVFDITGKSANKDNPFGNLLPLMMLNNGDDFSKMLPLFMMNQNKDIDPMMMALMMSDNKDMNKILPFMMMNQNKDIDPMMMALMMSDNKDMNKMLPFLMMNQNSVKNNSATNKTVTDKTTKPATSRSTTKNKSTQTKSSKKEPVTSEAPTNKKIGF